MTISESDSGIQTPQPATPSDDDAPEISPGRPIGGPGDPIAVGALAALIDSAEARRIAIDAGGTGEVLYDDLPAQVICDQALTGADFDLDHVKWHEQTWLWVESIESFPPFRDSMAVTFVRRWMRCRALELLKATCVWAAEVIDDDRGFAGQVPGELMRALERMDTAFIDDQRDEHKQREAA